MSVLSDDVCPYCQTPLRREVRPYALRGIYLGRFEFLVCPIESRVFHPRETSAAIEGVARGKGLFVPAPMERNLAQVCNVTVPPMVSIVVAVSKPREPETKLAGSDGNIAFRRGNEAEISFEETIIPPPATNIPPPATS